MIQAICLVALMIVVGLRARSSWHKPAWWATAFGAIAVATYGILWATPVVLDGMLGGRNLLTLVRDAAAVAAVWFFHNAVAAQQRKPEKKLPAWGLGLAVLSFTVPFLLISRPGPTSSAFVLDRLDQFPVWLFSSVYIFIVGALAARAIALLSSEKTVMTRFYVLGLSLMLVGSIIELMYLAATHFGPTNPDFRESLYYVAERPFFGGIFITVLGFLWVYAVRVFWTHLARWTLRIDARHEGGEYLARSLATSSENGWSDRQLAVNSAVNIRDRLKIGTQALSRREHALFSGVEHLLSNHLERTPR